MGLIERMNMEEYQVLARKYRPQRFSEVIGQEAIITTLKNAIGLNRVAHAYLFTGSRGTGKTTLARLFAKALVCPFLSSDLEPCNQCPSCKDIHSGNAIDVLEIDGASHRGIEDIRQINETIGFVPSKGRYKIYLIDEVHMLTKEAFNALLKTLEEPPPHVKFFFATTEPNKLPATILSRCQRFNLGRISSEKIQQKLLSIAQDLGVSMDEEAALLLAELSEGSLRDSEMLLDQILIFQKEKITKTTLYEVLGIASKDLFFALDEKGAKKNLTVAFEIAEEVFSSGKNVSYFIEELIQHFRTLFLLKQNVSISTQDKERYEHSKTLYTNPQLLEILDLLMEASHSLKWTSSEKVALEMLLLKIIRTHQRISLESLVERLENLEAMLTAKLTSKHTPTEKPFSVQTTNPPPEAFQNQRLTETPKPESPKIKEPEPIKLSIQEQSRFDTLMQFTAKELNGSLKRL